MIGYLLYLTARGDWRACYYEFDENGRSLTRTHVHRDNRRTRDRVTTWSVGEMESSYGTKKGDRYNTTIRCPFGDLTATGRWRRVTKCQFRAFLKKQGVRL